MFTLRELTIFSLFLGGEFREVYRGLDCEHTFTGLSPGLLYRIRFAAVSDGGTSEVSDPVLCKFKEVQTKFSEHWWIM